MFKKMIQYRNSIVFLSVILLWGTILTAQRFNGAPEPFFMSTAAGGAGTATTNPQLTLNQMFGLLIGTPVGTGASYQTPTAAQLCTVWPGVAIIAPGTNSQSQGATWVVKNTSAAANTITVTPNSGVTLNGTMTVAQNQVRIFKLVPTNCVPGSELYDVESIGNSVAF